MEGYVILLVILVLVLISVFYVINKYNVLVALRNGVRTQWAQIDVLLKKRVDLVPNLVEVVKGYAAHEKGTLEAVISARAKAVNAKNADEEIAAAGELTQALGRLMAIAEAYPDLKANVNFLDLQQNLREIENQIAAERQLYNQSNLYYKNSTETFPGNVIAGMFGFKSEAFFEAKEAEREVPQVKF